MANNSDTEVYSNAWHYWRWLSSAQNQIERFSSIDLLGEESLFASFEDQSSISKSLSPFQNLTNRISTVSIVDLQCIIILLVEPYLDEILECNKYNYSILMSIVIFLNRSFIKQSLKLALQRTFKQDIFIHTSFIKRSDLKQQSLISR